MEGEILLVNQQPDGFNEQWFPQLPDGYERQMQPMQQQGGWQPGMGQMQSMPSNWQPGMNQGHGGGMHGWPSGQGMPGHGPQPFRPPGQQGPGRPPSFPPGFPPGQQPWNPPGNQGQQGQQGPSSPPPNYTPQYPEAQLFRVDPGAIRGCLYRYTFVWLSRRQGFWFYPTFVGRTSVAGYRWRSRRRRWEYFGIDLNNIDSFTCF